MPENANNNLVMQLLVLQHHLLRPLGVSSLVVDRQAAPSGGYPRAKIKRQTEQCFWLYGVRLMLGEDLHPFPDLGGEDCDVLQPLPHDGMLLGPETPYPGATFAQVASSLEGNWFCQHVLAVALENKEPLTPEQYRPSEVVTCSWHAHDEVRPRQSAWQTGLQPR